MTEKKLFLAALELFEMIPTFLSTAQQESQQVFPAKF